MMHQDSTRVCPFCDGPVHPDPEREGVLYCPECQEPVAFDPPTADHLMSVSEERLFDDPALLGAWVASVARVTGYDLVIAGIKAIKAGCLDRYIEATQGSEALADWKEYERSRLGARDD